MAHLLELPNKINLSREDYLKVQQITAEPFSTEAWTGECGHSPAYRFEHFPRR